MDFPGSVYSAGTRTQTLTAIVWEPPSWYSVNKTVLSTPTEHPQNSRSYFVPDKLHLSYHYIHSMVHACSSMGILSLSP